MYVATSGRGTIHRFHPPFPESVAGCTGRDETGAPLAEGVRRDVFARGLYTFSGLAFARNGNLYAASVFTGEIVELDAEASSSASSSTRRAGCRPSRRGRPRASRSTRRGSVYFADLDLVWDFPAIDAGPNGRVRRIRFDAQGEPLPPRRCSRDWRSPTAWRSRRARCAEFAPAPILESHE